MQKWLKVLLGIAIVALIAMLALRYAERTRVVEGTWIYVFEGSNFYENRSPGHECELYREKGYWLNFSPDQIYDHYTYKKVWPSSGILSSHEYGTYRIEAFEVKFEGRKRFSLFGTGHLSLWASEYDVIEMLEVKPIPNLHCTDR